MRSCFPALERAPLQPMPARLGGAQQNRCTCPRRVIEWTRGFGNLTLCSLPCRSRRVPASLAAVDSGPSISDSTKPRNWRGWFLLLMLMTGIYSVAYLLWFWATPLGQSPVLDGRENIILARQIADQRLPAEPFFRAMLYPGVLSLFARGGLDDADLLVVAGGIGAFFHLLATAGIFRSALLLWKNETAAFLSAVLFGLYPLNSYFAAEPLDTTFSLSMVIVGIWAALSALEDGSADAASKQRLIVKSAASGALLSLAFLARPNFLPVLLVTPLAVAVAQRRFRVISATAIILGMAPAILLYGSWQKAVSAHFGVMPWQGGFSLWAANGEDANGRYYAQQSILAYEGPHQNPARVESEVIYLAETRAAVAEPSTVDRYWRDKTKAFILNQPGRWLGLEGRKVYFYLNDFEQYNNKTYSFHRDRCPLLQWNPLSWGILFCLSAIGCFAAWAINFRIATALVLLGIAYFGGALLVFAGDRFRLPLVPFAALFAGGCVPIVSACWQGWSAFRRMACVFAGIAALVIAFSRVGDVRDTSTYVQDRMLLANAALRVGHDEEAEMIAREILRENGQRSDAKNIAATARFNQHLQGTKRIDNPEAWQQIATDIAGSPALLPGMKWILAVAEWNSGHQEIAIRRWRELSTGGPSRVSADALAMLVLSGHATPEENSKLLELDWKKQSPYVWTARLALEGSAFERQIRTVLPEEKWKQVQEAGSRLLSGVALPYPQ
jgi:hypothetical protein